MSCLPKEVDYFVKDWQAAAQAHGHRIRIISFAAPKTLFTALLSPECIGTGLLCRDFPDLSKSSQATQIEHRAWYTYQRCSEAALSHLDVFCSTQLDVVISFVWGRLKEELFSLPNQQPGTPPHSRVVLAGCSQGGTVALALALEMARQQHPPGLLLLYHSTIMEHHLAEALRQDNLKLILHLQLASRDEVYCPTVVKRQGEKLAKAGHVVTVSQDTNGSWHGGDTDLEPSKVALGSFLSQLSGK
jgi:hypothetical protein